MPHHLRVPASSANLGPGFDALGLALGIYLECRFEQSARLSIAVKGRDADCISKGEDNLIWQTALAVARDVGGALPLIELEIENDIPIGKGLGSSAAALRKCTSAASASPFWRSTPASSRYRNALSGELAIAAT